RPPDRRRALRSAGVLTPDLEPRAVADREAVDPVTITAQHERPGDVHELLDPTGLAPRARVVVLLPGDDVAARDQRRDRTLLEVEAGGAVRAGVLHSDQLARCDHRDRQAVVHAD